MLYSIASNSTWIVPQMTTVLFVKMSCHVMYFYIVSDVTFYVYLTLLRTMSHVNLYEYYYSSKVLVHVANSSRNLCTLKLILQHAVKMQLSVKKTTYCTLQVIDPQGPSM